MACRVCPWWLGYLLVSPLRRLRQNPRRILQPFVADGMMVLEPGSGMGFFTIELARLAGPQGRIVAVDIQPRMLTALVKRARRAGVADRIDARLCAADEMHVDDLHGAVDFVLAFAMVHELPDAGSFFAEVSRALKVGGRMLVAEPRGHVRQSSFDETIRTAEKTGFRLVSRPSIRWSRAAVLERMAR